MPSHLSDDGINALTLEHWKLLGRSVMERSRIWLGSGKQITDIVTIYSAITLGGLKPRLFINPHFARIEGGFMALSVLASQHDWRRRPVSKYENPLFN